MPYKPLTHEQFHTGLSAMGNDQKWSDMRNFRSQNGRTRAVPRKFVLLEEDNLHTVISLGNQVNYALGSASAFNFSSNDSITQNEILWRVKVTHDTSINEKPRNLPVRGHYTLDEGVRFAVSVEKETPAVVTPETPTVPEIECYGCCDGGEVIVIGTNKLEDDTPIPGGVVKFFQKGALVKAVVPNGGGLWRVEIPIGYYYVTIDIPGYHLYVQIVNVSTEANIEFVVVEESESVHLLQAGARLLLHYAVDEYGYFENLPSNITINGVDLGEGYIWGLGGGFPDPLTGLAEFTLSTPQVLEIWAAQAPGVDSYTIVVPNLAGALFTGMFMYSHLNDTLLDNTDVPDQIVTFP